jgi:hypothetical protein
MLDVESVASIEIQKVAGQCAVQSEVRILWVQEAEDGNNAGAPRFSEPSVNDVDWHLRCRTERTPGPGSARKGVRNMPVHEWGIGRQGKDTIHLRNSSVPFKGPLSSPIGAF